MRRKTHARCQERQVGRHSSGCGAGCNRLWRRRERRQGQRQQGCGRPERQVLRRGGRAGEPASAGQHHGVQRQHRHSRAVLAARELRRQGQHRDGQRRVGGDQGQQDLHGQAEGRLEVPRRHPRHRRVVRQGVELGREPEEQAEEQLLVLRHQGLRRGLARQGRPQGHRAVRSEGRRRDLLHDRAVHPHPVLRVQAGLRGLLAASRVLLRGPREGGPEARRQRPVQVRELAAQEADRGRALRRVRRPRQGQERWCGLQELHQPGDGLRGPEVGQRRRPASDRPEGPAGLQAGPRRPRGRHVELGDPDDRSRVLHRPVQGHRPQGRQGPVDGDRPGDHHQDGPPGHPRACDRLGRPGRPRLPAASATSSARCSGSTRDCPRRRPRPSPSN
ncbi:hypothetical protein YW7DRAFT_01135 [Streptomyces sp. AmelKG-E11A]|nr:hypothetical protein YW7DRAFT_01135 [Streptomyces sp. AmelKG-E11A]